MGTSADREARWRAKASDFRARAARSPDPGAQAAFAALAEVCEDIIIRLAGSTAATGAVSSSFDVVHHAVRSDHRALGRHRWMT